MYANGYSKVFFDGTSTQSYFSTIHQKMKDEVEEMNNTTIVSCDFQEWADYLSNKYYIPPILIFETNVEPNLIETPVKKQIRSTTFLMSRNIMRLMVYV